MLVKYLSKSEPLTLVILIILLVLRALTYHVWGSTVEVDLEIGKIMGIIVVFALLIVGNQVMLRNQLRVGSGYLAVFIFILLLWVFPKVMHWHPVILTSLVQVWMMWKIWHLKNKNRVQADLLDAGILIGISFLLFPPSIIFSILIYIGYFLYINIIDKRLLIPFVGFSVVMVLTYTYHYLLGNLSAFYALFVWNYQWSYTVFIENWGTWSIFGIYVLVGVLGVVTKGMTSSLEEERFYKLVIPHLLLSIFLVLVTGSEVPESVLFVLMSASVFVAYSIENIHKKRLQETTLWVLILWTVWKVIL